MDGGDPHILNYTGGKKEEEKKKRKSGRLNYCCILQQTEAKTIMMMMMIFFFRERERITRKPFIISLVVAWAVHAKPQWRTERMWN